MSSEGGWSVGCGVWGDIGFLHSPHSTPHTPHTWAGNRSYRLLCSRRDGFKSTSRNDRSLLNAPVLPMVRRRSGLRFAPPARNVNQVRAAQLVVVCSWNREYL